MLRLCRSCGISSPCCNSSRCVTAEVPGLHVQLSIDCAQVSR